MSYNPLHDHILTELAAFQLHSAIKNHIFSCVCKNYKVLFDESTKMFNHRYTF